MFWFYVNVDVQRVEIFFTELMDSTNPLDIADWEFRIEFGPETPLDIRWIDAQHAQFDFFNVTTSMGDGTLTYTNNSNNLKLAVGNVCNTTAQGGVPET